MSGKTQVVDLDDVIEFIEHLCSKMSKSSLKKEKRYIEQKMKELFGVNIRWCDEEGD